MGLRTRRFPNERLVVLAGLVLASGLCLALEVVRERHFGTLDFRFLLWNLFLAWIPLVLALVVYDRYRRGTPLFRLAPLHPLYLAGVLGVAGILAWEHSLVGPQDLSRVMQAFNLNGWVSLGYFVVTAAAAWLRQ